MIVPPPDVVQSALWARSDPPPHAHHLLRLEQMPVKAPGGIGKKGMYKSSDNFPSNFCVPVMMYDVRYLIITVP